LVVEHGHWMGGDGGLGCGFVAESREARLATPHRSRIPFLISKVGRGGMRAARCVVPLSCARSPVSYPRSRVSNRIHASGFTTAYRAVPIPIAFIGPVPAADRIASIHPLREALVQREKTAHSWSPARSRSIRLSLGGGRTRGRENKRGQSLPREAPTS
jgi:hypothetical protein